MNSKGVVVDIALEVEPRSPERHELWKASRKKKSGSYVSGESASIGSKIDELIVMGSQGSFVPHGKNDILTTALRTPEHLGRCREAGKGVGRKKYFGGVTRSGSSCLEVAKVEFMKEIMDGVDIMVQDRVSKALAEELKPKHATFAGA